ncbi:hypothetical protein [Actinoplanes lobatus]|uniref:Uncharacterized protein n=1 Tax=Actinoplanes lobatus TaxID=113568 RepID=A0A7W7ML55_9ACTN|nr:hypothetical protein [Actinoplanes lobatus]MBB4753780.1 hypothetical protein [Actinoplanes lobatus]
MQQAAIRFRLEESISDLDEFRDDVAEWAVSARQLGPQGQYLDQMSLLAEIAETGIAQVRHDLLEQTTGATGGELYEQCRRADHRTALLRRFWRWYGDRLDQRHHDDYRPTLAAADEIVHSTWQALFPDAATRPPTPLPHVAPIDTAVSTARYEVPLDLCVPAEPVLARWTTMMPLSTIALPSTVTRRPWWLVVLAHECGHQVAAEVGEDDDGSGSPPEVLGAAAARAGAGDAEQREWRNWAMELFADATAAVTKGTAPMWSVMELERGTPDTLLRPDIRYPPPALRWCVADAVVAGIGLAGVVPAADRALLAGSPFAGHAARAETIAGALLGIRFGGTTLREIGVRSRDWERTARRWRDALLGATEPAAGTAPESARLCVAGGTMAWRRTTAGPGGAEDRERLRRRLLRVLPQSRPKSVRHVGVRPQRQAAAVTRQVLDDLRSDAW